MSGNVLRADSLLNLMTASLPSSTRLKEPCAAVALFCHASMLAVGFRLVGLGEDDQIDAPSTADATPPLPREWADKSPYSFRYAHSQSSMQYIIKISRLGSKAVIFSIAVGADKTISFDITIKDFLSESAFPFTQSADERSLQNAFISTNRIDDLASLYKINIIQKLVPGIHKEGYEESATTRTPGDRQGESRVPAQDPLRDGRLPEPVRPRPLIDPVPEAPQRPYPDFPPPGFDDEYEQGRQQPRLRDTRPLNIGERDLYPPGLGPYDPLGRSNPTYGDGGMHPTFDDPLFRDPARGGRQSGYDPSIPPGARYDPLHPDDTSDSAMRPRFPGGNLRGGPHNPFGGGGFGGGFGSGFSGSFGGDII